MTEWHNDKLQIGRLVGRRLRENWAAPLDHSLEQMANQPLTNERLRALRFFWFDGLFAAGSEAFFLNYTALFAVAFGATNGQIGLLTALANLAGAIINGYWEGALLEGANVENANLKGCRCHLKELRKTIGEPQLMPNGKPPTSGWRGRKPRKSAEPEL